MFECKLKPLGESRYDKIEHLTEESVFVTSAWAKLDNVKLTQDTEYDSSHGWLRYTGAYEGSY